MFCLYGIRSGREDDGIIEADGKARNGAKIASPPLPPEGGSKTVLLLRCSGGCCVGSIATAVEKRKVHDV